MKADSTAVHERIASRRRASIPSFAVASGFCETSCMSRRLLIGIVVGASASAFACGSSYAGDDVTAPAPAPAETSPDASTTPTTDVPPIPQVSVDGPCEVETPSEDGVFVSKTRGADENAGTAVSPVATLGRALALATGDAHREIYVAQGIYEEPSALVVQARDLRVSGGWKEDPVRWTRDCSPGRRMKTVLYVAASPALSDAFSEGGASGKVALEALSLATVSKMSASASAYALFLKGEGPEWNLSDVTLVADRGLDGATAPPAPGPAGPCLPCAAGAAGGVGGEGGPVAPAFTPDGFVPGDGKTGAPGGAGGAGKAPGAPPTVQAFDGGCGQKTKPMCQSQTPRKTVTGNAGKCGCGGAGGAGGGGGKGGGASVALFVSGTRQVRAQYTYLKATGGGDGAPGGAGAPGAGGTAGAGGAAKTYDARHCENQPNADKCTASEASIKTLAGATAGGPGGAGGAGGHGGPGAGGASVGLVRLGAAVELGEAVTFEVGPAGKAAPGAESGPAAERLDLEK